MRISGRKFYTTGALYSDLINTIATGEDGTHYSVVVDLKAPGVQIVDDWNGFGQRLTASGTCIFDNAPVVDDDLRRPSSALATANRSSSSTTSAPSPASPAALR